MNKFVVIVVLVSVGLACIIGCTSTEHKTQNIPPTESTKKPQYSIQTEKAESNQNPAQDIQTAVPEPNHPAESKQEPNHPAESKQEPNHPAEAKQEPNHPAEAKQEPNHPAESKQEPNEPVIIKTEPDEPNEPQISKADPNEPDDSNFPPQVDFHEKCAPILTTYVDTTGMVDYPNLKRRRVELRDLLQEFKNLDQNKYKSWPREDKIAFWINAYNIQLLNIIIENYPIESDPFSRIFKWPPDSVRYIDRKLSGIEKQKFNIMNEEFTLERIERRFFHEQFNEPKAFLALFHGGLSGPSLLNKPYYGKTLYQQLEEQIKKTLLHSESFTIDSDKHIVYLHSILQPESWYGNYFLDKYKIEKWFKDQTPEVRAVINFLTEYLTEQQVNYLKFENYTVKFSPYNWRLNERR